MERSLFHLDYRKLELPPEKERGFFHPVDRNLDLLVDRDFTEQKMGNVYGPGMMERMMKIGFEDAVMNMAQESFSLILKAEFNKGREQVTFKINFLIRRSEDAFGFINEDLKLRWVRAKMGNTERLFIVNRKEDLLRPSKMVDLLKSTRLGKAKAAREDTLINRTRKMRV